MTEVKLTQAKSSLFNGFELSNDFTRVSGFAVHEGTFNQITILKEELEKSVSSLIGSPILKDHERKADNVVGKVTYADIRVDPDTATPGIYYEADIDKDEESFLKKIEKDLLNAVSVSFNCEHICSICGKPIFECDHWFDNEDFQIIARNMRFHELSVVAVPADSDATVSIEFADDEINFEELKNQKQKRRTKMSEFEQKYTQVVEEFSNYKMEKNDEITGLKEEFKAKEEEYEMKISDKVEEALALKTELEKFEKENATLNEKVTEYENKFAEIEEEKLSDLRKQVTDLNADVKAGLEAEEIENLSEKMLNRYVDMFTSIKENTVEVKPANNSEDKYDDNGNDADQFADDPLASLLHRIQ